MLLSVRSLVACLVVAATTAFAQPVDWGQQAEWAKDYPQSQAICRSVADRTVPDEPDARTAADLKGCDAEALYYGIGRPADPTKARKCAMAQARDPASRDDPFTGESILMMVYANGRGAARDLDLATHLACRLPGAPAESHYRVMSLAAMKAQKSPAVFDVCDDMTSGLGGGYCARHAQRFEVARREAALLRLEKAWTPAGRRAFADLRAKATTFFDARAGNEVDLSGTLRGAFVVEDKEARWKEFHALLERLSKGQPVGPATAVQADKALNSAYRTVLAAKKPAGTIQPQAVRESQRAWLAYRDAWLTFAAVTYPRASRATVLTSLTRTRTKMLRDLAKLLAEA